jgi:tetratricopeptide (TPR) repeat protein
MNVIARLLAALMLVSLSHPSFAMTADADADAGTRHAVLVPKSGTYSRAISTDIDLAQTYFDQGLRLAWGFYFPESIASYQEASRLDPTHPMPYWGIAHAAGPNPNSRYAQMPDDPQGAGLAAIEAALDRIDRATPMEAALIKALNVFYDAKSIPDPRERDRAYLAEMRELNKKHPDDPDIAALYAGSFMSIRRWDYWDKSGEAKGETLAVAEALEHVINTGDPHPGVYHLHIHLIEASLEPERAMVSADALEATLPIGGHVVHMPAHIFVRVGDYQRAIDNNLRSLAVDKEFAQHWGDLPLPNIGTYPLSHKIHAGHALDFVRYAATMQGSSELAIKSAKQMAEAISQHGTPMGRMQKRVAAPWVTLKIFGQWDELLAIEGLKQSTPYLDGILSYVKGSAHIAKGSLDQAKEQLSDIQRIAQSPDVSVNRAGATATAELLALAAHALDGEIKLAEGDLAGAIVAFEKGVALEDTNNYTEPPDWPQSMRLYLGNALLEAGRFEEAEAVFRKDLRWHQNNGWSLFGLMKALEAQNKKNEAKVIQNQWTSVWSRADVQLTSPVIL